MNYNYDNDDNDRVGPFKQHDSDDPASYSSAVFGRVGTGKTPQAMKLIHRLMDDAESVEFTDPKDETGEQS